MLSSVGDCAKSKASIAASLAQAYLCYRDEIVCYNQMPITVTSSAFEENVAKAAPHTYPPPFATAYVRIDSLQQLCSGSR